MTSRLDRLFVLLESGSSNVTRLAAAKQFGEVQKLHPHQLHLLLNRLLKYLYSSSWETSMAAGQAIGAIVNNVPVWLPTSQPNSTILHYCSCHNQDCLLIHAKLQLDSFSVKDCLSNKLHLLGSKGAEFDSDDSETTTKGDQVKRQKDRINAQLGFDLLSKFGIDSGSEIISSEDLLSKTSETKIEIEIETNGDCSNLSSRERNRAKRKARQQQTSTNKSSLNEKFGNCDSLSKKLKLIDFDKLVDDYGVPDSTNIWPACLNQWPLNYFCETLLTDFFHSSWEVRHGAAIGFREIIRLHGKSVGKFADLSSEQMEIHHEIWVEDAIVRILYILTLDRFGDFVSDTVVAPVRETCAQCLATLVPLMKPKKIRVVLGILLDLSLQSEWEVRHAGLLGVKYLLAVINTDLVNDLVQMAFPYICTCLSDSMDDVASVAASTFTPVTKIIVHHLPQNVHSLLSKLWDLLLEQDELTAACTSFMELLSKLIQFTQVQDMLKSNSFVNYLPRLIPFLWHNSSTVRKCTLQTFEALTKNIEIDWTVEILQEFLRNLYQLVIVEQVKELQVIAELIWENVLMKSDLMLLLHAICPYVNNWLVLAMYSAKYPIDPSLLITCNMTKNEKNSDFEPSTSNLAMNQSMKWFIGGNESVSLDVRETTAIRSRLIACRMLGALSVYVIREIGGVESQETPIDYYVNMLRTYLNSKSAMQRLVIGLVIAEWSQRQTTSIMLPESLKNDLIHCLTEYVYFDEIAGIFTGLVQEYRDFIATLKHYKIDSENADIFNDTTTITLSKILKNCDQEMQKFISGMKLRPNITDKLEQRRQHIQQLVTQTNQDQLAYSISSLSTIAGAVVMFDILPEKLNPVVKPLMESIKRETCPEMQKVIAEFLSKLTYLCINRDPCPNPKIINNLVGFLCSDENLTPKINDDGPFGGIVTLEKQRKEAEISLNQSKRNSKVIDSTNLVDDVHKSHQVQRSGACLALKTITDKFGSNLPSNLPRLWEIIYLELVQSIDLNVSDLISFKNEKSNVENLISNLQVLEVISDCLDESLQEKVFIHILPRLCIFSSHPYSAVRHMSARCLAALSKINSIAVMEMIVTKLIPNLSADRNEIVRQGVVEVISLIINALHIDVVPFIVILIVPLLGRMSDQCEPVRLLAAQSFAILVQLLPLDSRVRDESQSFNNSFLCEKRDHDRFFIERLLSPKSIPDYVIPVPISVELRSYQQAGVNWLAFLNQYQLHGILCDDMGLGKTLQSICMLAADHFHRNNDANCQPSPSLVVCPATLTGHWFYEIEKFVSSKYLRPFQIVGPPTERLKLRKQYKDYDVIIVSYNTLCKDIDFFKNISWNYCILDEGHVIKNSKTRTSMMLKSLKSNHRLLLSGTPIQNNVLDLWSLFDFLMPGFLGSERQFNAAFSRPIVAARDSKCTQREQEAGVLAMETLHRQVLPFLLRRMKEDVLDDLPPKITQDYYCELTPLQQELYEDFAKSSAHQMLQDSVKNIEDVSEKSTPIHSHIFQALRYLQNVCNHPKLVLNLKHPKFDKINADLLKKRQNLNNIKHSAKLLGLSELLRECNIGVSNVADDAKQLLVANQHRALIFCQSKAMINIIEEDLFKTMMPDITHLRLDGSVLLSERHGIVTKFNNDPSIDVLLLTTQIGGLGLNLTGADTVIFVEHDWNPMKDLQAMDRAHRIGQKKVVNVYRLITRGTLEEKIMGLQKFKLRTANTVITSENEHMETMATDQLFDLFTFKDTNNETSTDDGSHKVSKATNVKTILDSLPNLWDPSQYEDEYNMDQFIAKMNTT